MKRSATTDSENQGSAKMRLLDAAEDIFGRYGYEASTTRMIAKEAGVNISSIPYYFGGKEGLYNAVITNVASVIRSQLSAVEKEIGVTDFSGPRGHIKASEMLERLLSEILTFMLGAPQAQRFGRIILREQLDPSAAYDIIFKGFMEVVLDVTADLILLASEHVTRRTAKIKAVSMLGQIIVFRFARETVVRGLDMQGYSPAEVDEVNQVVRQHTRAIMATL